MDRPEAALFRALSFIETHLDEELSVQRVAGEAFYSPYHFHRLFVQLTGEGLAAYVRRLRLESAPRQWGLRIHPVRPPYEEFVPGGLLITVPLG